MSRRRPFGPIPLYDMVAEDEQVPAHLLPGAQQAVLNGEDLIDFPTSISAAEAYAAKGLTKPFPPEFYAQRHHPDIPMDARIQELEKEIKRLRRQRKSKKDTGQQSAQAPKALKPKQPKKRVVGYSRDSVVACNDKDGTEGDQDAA